MHKEKLMKLLRPSGRAVLITDLIAIPLTVISLSMLAPAHPVSLAAYILSSYALVITVINFKTLMTRLKALLKGDELAVVRRTKAFLRRYKFTRMYLESRDFRAEVGLYMSLAINMFYAVFKGVTGAIYRSPWLWSMGVYYLFLGGIRFFLMCGVRKKLGTESSRELKLHEYKTYRLCGCMMMILNLAVGGMAIQMIWQNKANEFSKVTVIISATYTFYCFILSVYNVVTFRKSSAILSAAKDLALTGAVMSMYSLQTSMLHTFSSGNDEHFRRIMNSVTGGFVIAIVLGIATYMIINGTRKIESFRGEE